MRHAEAGACASGEACQCRQVEPCPPCFDDECALYRVCTSEFGQCFVDCVGDIPVVVEPPGGCDVHMENLPESIIGAVQVEVDDDRLHGVDDCAERSDAWTWVDEGVTLRLCEQACDAVLPRSELYVGWAVPCE